MKRYIAAVVMLGALAFASVAQAAATADLTITVTPNGSKSITLSGATLALGTLNLASVDNVSSSITVTNDGTLQCRLGLRVKTDDAVWDANASVGADQYNLRALFNSSSPAPGAGDFAVNDDVLTGAAVLATSGGVYSGDQNAQAFDAGDTRGLWFKIDMPTTSTVGTQRTIVVEVSAN